MLTNIVTHSYIGYGRDQAFMRQSAKEESLLSFLSLVQSLLLGSFAAILAAHRSEILDKPGGAVMEMMDELHGIPTGKEHYQAPAASET